VGEPDICMLLQMITIFRSDCPKVACQQTICRELFKSGNMECLGSEEPFRSGLEHIPHQTEMANISVISSVFTRRKTF
jgi:hypothetical protein